MKLFFSSEMDWQKLTFWIEEKEEEDDDNDDNNDDDDDDNEDGIPGKQKYFSYCIIHTL